MKTDAVIPCYLSSLLSSFICSFFAYMTAYSIQSRYSYYKNRFSLVDKDALGLWKPFIVFPAGYRKLKNPFVITADGEKWAIVHFLADTVILFVLVFTLCRRTSFNRKDVFFCCFVISAVPLMISSLWIQIISNRILALPQAVRNSDVMLDRHIANHLKKLQMQYSGPEYQFKRIVIRKQRFGETKDLCKVIVCRTNGDIIEENTLAIKQSSRYYEGIEITLL